VSTLGDSSRCVQHTHIRKLDTTKVTKALHDVVREVLSVGRHVGRSSAHVMRRLLPLA